jgi:hypothetical protein
VEWRSCFGVTEATLGECCLCHNNENVKMAVSEWL